MSEADGRIRFRGRLKEIIKTGGVNVAPLEVEQVLLQHPDIVQAYVVGVPDRSKGEIVAAAIELRAGAATDPAAIVAFCRERLASYKVPARLAFRTAAQLPRSPGAAPRRSGKSRRASGSVAALPRSSTAAATISGMPTTKACTCRDAVAGLARPRAVRR